MMHVTLKSKQLQKGKWATMRQSGYNEAKGPQKRRSDNKRQKDHKKAKRAEYARVLQNRNLRKVQKLQHPNKKDT